MLMMAKMISYSRGSGLAARRARALCQVSGCLDRGKSAWSPNDLNWGLKSLHPPNSVLELNRDASLPFIEFR